MGHSGLSKSVVVVGASSGMGLATSKAAAEHGYAVTMVARRPDVLEDAADQIRSTLPDSNVQTAPLDAADPSMVEELAARLGPTDHVVSFAGEQPIGSIDDISYDTYQRAFDARVYAARNLCAAFHPTMPEDGSFVFCSGVSAMRARANRWAGAIATAALESFIRAMAVELAPTRVNGLRPGAFETPVLTRTFGDEREERMKPFLDRLPLGRVGKPEELADAALFLMGNTYTTGTMLGVDGGALLG